MAHIHTFIVRTAVKGGMYTLPSRDTFLQGLGEGGVLSLETIQLANLD